MGDQVKIAVIGLLASVAMIAPASAQYMGNLTVNRALPPAAPQPPGTFTNRFGNDSNSPKLYDRQGRFRGNLNDNPNDPNSVANPFGRYGSRFSPDSINNPNGRFGSRFSTQSPNNPFGMGLSIYGPRR